MMKKQHFDIAFIIPLEPRFFSLIQMFLRTTRSHYPTEQLPEIQIFGWITRGSLRIVLRFEAKSFNPEMFSWFQSWIQALNAEVVELESLDPKSKEKFLAKIKSTSEVIFTGNYDMERAVEELKTRFQRFHGTRKSPRFDDSLKVSFKVFKDFVGEYTDNISFGGMFIRGRTDLPPKSRVEIVLELPGMEEKIHAIAEVIHIIPREGGLGGGKKAVSGSGFQFVEFLDDGESRLREYIKKHFVGNGFRR